ncbi:MAG: hypothetical protein Q4G39_07770, partial [Brachymonas sp.]|nr:hypothetical protein [Brachymonas sp.]
MGLLLRELMGSALRLQFSYSTESVRHIVGRWSDAQWLRFHWHFAIDALLLLSYGALGCVWVHTTRAWQAASARQRRHAARLLPMAAVLDALENTLQLTLIQPTSPPHV